MGAAVEEEQSLGMMPTKAARQQMEYHCFLLLLRIKTTNYICIHALLNSLFGGHIYDGDEALHATTSVLSEKRSGDSVTVLAVCSWHSWLAYFMVQVLPLSEISEALER